MLAIATKTKLIKITNLTTDNIPPRLANAVLIRSLLLTQNIEQMNLEYLKNEIIPLREKEIEEGKNICTRQPIYVVLDLQENYVSGHSDYSPSTNHKGLPFEFGYIDEQLEGELRTFKKSDKRMKKPSEITKFYTDRIVAFFLTSKNAHDYLKYQSHNLENPYVYVFYSGYANREMDLLF